MSSHACSTRPVGGISRPCDSCCGQAGSPSDRATTRFGWCRLPSLLIPPELDERFHEPLVRVNDDIAVVWAHYDFLVDGVVHH